MYRSSLLSIQTFIMRTHDMRASWFMLPLLDMFGFGKLNETSLAYVCLLFLCECSGDVMMIGLPVDYFYL